MSSMKIAEYVKGVEVIAALLPSFARTFYYSLTINFVFLLSRSSGRFEQKF